MCMLDVGLNRVSAELSCSGALWDVLRCAKAKLGFKLAPSQQDRTLGRDHITARYHTARQKMEYRWQQDGTRSSSYCVVWSLLSILYFFLRIQEWAGFIYLICKFIQRKLNCTKIEFCKKK